MSEKLKIGVLGVGHLGEIHVKLIKEIPSFQLVGFYDINPQTSDYVSHTYGVKSYNSREELIKDVDVIDIVTPTPTHFDCAQAAIRAGKHIFIEKPVTFTVEESESLKKLSLKKLVQEAGIVAQVGHVERFNPAFLAVQNRLKKVLFIESKRFAIYNTRGVDVPVVLDLMIHDLDIVLSTVKSPIKRISATGLSVISDTVDIANVRLEFLNGAEANLSANRVAVSNHRVSEFYQSDSIIKVDFLNKEAVQYSVEPVGKVQARKKISIETEEGKEPMEIVIEKPEILLNNAIADELTEFAKSVLDNTPSLVPLEDGHNAVVVAHQILEKIQNKLGY